MRCKRLNRSRCISLYKYRVCLGNITNSSRHLHRRTKKIIAFLDGFTGMNADPYMDRALTVFVYRMRVSPESQLHTRPQPVRRRMTP